MLSRQISLFLFIIAYSLLFPSLFGNPFNDVVDKVSDAVPDKVSDKASEIAESIDLPDVPPLIDIRGNVRLSDGKSPVGVKISLKVDLDRNGVYTTPETAIAEADEKGVFRFSYKPQLADAPIEFVTFIRDLVTKFNNGGFAALVEGGPLAIAITFEKKGYSTITRIISAMNFDSVLDALLSPLVSMGCGVDGCYSEDAAVLLKGLQTGKQISEAYARAYTPERDGQKFPGSFTDDQDALLFSSGFVEIDLRDAEGKKITTFKQPAELQFKLFKPSWKTLIDLEPDTGLIEIPMYSFDSKTNKWIAEANGHLVDEKGIAIAEDRLDAIQNESFVGEIYAKTKISHLSTWNVDRSEDTHTCAKARILTAEGLPAVGVSATISGVSYSGWINKVTVGEDGYFAMGAKRSETTDEDLDRNRKTGETSQAQIVVWHQGKKFLGNPFDTSTLSNRIVKGHSITCRPADCDCPDLGELRLAPEAKIPSRLCNFSVSASFSGDVRRGSVSMNASLAADEPIGSVVLMGELVGNFSLNQQKTDELCADKPCGETVADAEGHATLSVPALEGGGKISVRGYYKRTIEGRETLYEVYSGDVTVEVCHDSDPIAIDLRLDYIALDDIRALEQQVKKVTDSVQTAVDGNGDFASSSEDNSANNSDSGGGCSCNKSTTGSNNSNGSTAKGIVPFALFLLPILLLRRRKK